MVAVTLANLKTALYAAWKLALTTLITIGVARLVTVLTKPYVRGPTKDDPALLAGSRANSHVS